jgi:hypothetical protein
MATCIFAGCIEEDGAAEPLQVTVTSPSTGSVLSGEGAVKFGCDVCGGRGPYSYRWTSNIDGPLSSSKSFTLRPSELRKGNHMIIVGVADSSGKEVQGSTSIRVR